MNTLERRIEALETKVSGDQLTIIIVSFVGCEGDAKPDPVRITRLGTDEEWLRQPDEDAKAFRARAKDAVQGRQGVVVLLEHNAEPCDGPQ